MIANSEIDHDFESESTNPWGRYRKARDYPTAKNFKVSLEWVLRRAIEHSTYVNIDYRVLGGTPRIGNTRIPVYMILQAVEHHGTLDGALKAYPQLTLDQVSDAVLFAASVLECSVDGD